MTEKSSRISGFYKLAPAERLGRVSEYAGLAEDERNAISETGLPLDVADRMIENVIGTHELPLGIATNFQINGRDYLIPMAIEEPSVVAAASNLAKIARAGGGFKTESTDPVMIGQIQVLGVEDPKKAKEVILGKKDDIISFCNEQDPVLVKFGGGCRDVEVNIRESKVGPMVIVHLLVDVRDAMGANAVNTMAEAAAPKIEEWTGGKVGLRIISNLADKRVARAEAVFPKDALGGEDVVDAIVSAWAFADCNPYRCATHNKGIMNGVSAVVVATGNDFRAVEAGAHSFAARSGEYKPLTTYEKNGDGDLVGKIEIPMAVGLIGGATKTHPTARASVKILGVKTASELGEVMAAVGLAQNAAALKALATEGIQRGDMKLHARNIAVTAGAKESEIDEVAKKLSEEGKVRVDRAKEILDEMRKER